MNKIDYRFFVVCSVTILLVSCTSIDIRTEKAKAIKQYNNGNFNQAINTFNKIIAATDTFAECFLYRGLSFKEVKQYDDAIKDLNSYINIYKREPLGYANRASVFYLKNDFKSALGDYIKAYQLDPSRTKLLFNPISHMFFATGQKDSSCFYYEKAKSIGDTNFNQSIKKYCEQKNK
jgi:tetratricopeptide (TPR) repeat protein